jgi:CO/xanthine dehydrogenase FAD-binding subunit
MGRYLRPTSLDAALLALSEERWTVLAGGTDHYPARVLAQPDEDLLDISALPELAPKTDGIRLPFLPALTTWSDLIAADLPSVVDGLKAAARQVGGVQVQNAGTILGNLCNASPAADGIPCLLALDASVELRSRSGGRLLPLYEFLLGPRRTARRPDELAIGLHIPLPALPARATFEKLGSRRYLVISIAMVAAVAEFAADGRIARARVAVGACSPVAARLPALEAALAGRFPDAALVLPEHLASLTPIDDVRAPADYRRTAALELVRRAVAGLAAPQAIAA